MAKKFRKISIVFLLAVLPLQSFAQEKAQLVLDTAKQQAVVEEVSKLLNENYIFPETAKKMEELIRTRLKKGEYKALQNPRDFAAKVMEDLRSVSKDKHLRFHYEPEAAEQITQSKSESEATVKEARDRQLAAVKRDNFGFRKVERLQGNIGHIDFRYFASAADAGETAVAALGFVANCDAVIIDLRQNGGGDPSQIQLISSYFFEEPTHLNDIFTRRENKTENFWTFSYVPGQKLTKADLYVLTSGNTFSGAEEFSYNMKNLKRATLIGETTGGGAHPTEPMIVQSQFVLAVPYARAINPITKTNWEGTGVTPDIQAPAAQAFDKAYGLALEKLLTKASDAETKNQIEWVLTGQKAKMNPVQVSQETLAKYVGVYQDRKITMENGTLYYQRLGPKYRLIPLTLSIFEPEGLEFFRVEFVVKNGTAAELIGLYDNGEREPSKRTQ